MTGPMHTRWWKDQLTLGIVVIAAIILWVAILQPVWGLAVALWEAWGW